MKSASLSLQLRRREAVPPRPAIACSERAHVFLVGARTCSCRKMKMVDCTCPTCHQTHQHAEPAGGMPHAFMVNK